MTADHSTREERRRWCLCSRADRMNDRARPECPLHGDSAVSIAYRDGLADAALVAADPAPTQSEVGLRGYDVGCFHEHGGASDHAACLVWRKGEAARLNDLLAARAAQPVPAPEVSRGVAEVKAEALREAADDWESDARGPVSGARLLRERADRIVRDALPAEGES